MRAASVMCLPSGCVTLTRTHAHTTALLLLRLLRRREVGEDFAPELHARAQGHERWSEVSRCVCVCACVVRTWQGLDLLGLGEALKGGVDDA